MPMKIYVNGEERSCSDTLVLAALLENIGLAQKRIAVEVNREIVPRTQHSQRRLQEGDHVEIVQAIGGG